MNRKRKEGQNFAALHTLDMVSSCVCTASQAAESFHGEWHVHTQRMLVMVWLCFALCTEAPRHGHAVQRTCATSASPCCSACRSTPAALASSSRLSLRKPSTMPRSSASRAAASSLTPASCDSSSRTRLQHSAVSGTAHFASRAQSSSPYVSLRRGREAHASSKLDVHTCEALPS